MLAREENEALCRVGPGTLMGNLIRQYWVPAALSSELPAPDADPLRVMLLGEPLIAFRDSNGRVGLIQNHCPHRGASLFFGRNEECGIRCVYHGWKFDVEGNCTDMPNEPAESNFKAKVRAVAYPTKERNGIVWAYLGPRSTPPPLPSLEGNMLADGEWQVTAIQRECNWFQGLEGDIDTSHFSFLHAGSMDPGTQEPGTFSYYMLADRAPRYSVVDTDFGTMYGAYRDTSDDRRYWRVANFLFPFWTMPPQGVLGHKVTARGWVPMDDTHTMFFMAGPKLRRRPSPDRDRPATSDGPNRGPAPAGPAGGMVPNSTDWFGRFRLAANATNDYQIDREKQRRNHAMEDFTGITGIHLQDQAVTESEGPVYDRSGEHLASSDAMVIRSRQRLLAAARALAEHGVTPPGVDHPEVFGARAGGVFLPRDADWLEATEALRQGFVEHPELDLAITGPLV
ncbi:MAG: Rieske 2Fe-2S domain-containing protein [Acidimicrobiales bacterium]|nr:Rieske 2Fe-2S domain-containing protein [Acidimicrobiales bacterium]